MQDSRVPRLRDAPYAQGLCDSQKEDRLDLYNVSCLWITSARHAKHVFARCQTPPCLRDKPMQESRVKRAHRVEGTTRVLNTRTNSKDECLAAESNSKVRHTQKPFTAVLMG